MLHKIAPPFLHTVHRHVLLKGPCGYSNIPKSPQIVTSTGAYRKKHAAFLLKGPCGHSNIPKSPQMIASIGVYRKMRADYGSPSRLAPAAPSERGRLFVRGKRAAMSGVSAAHPRGHASSPNPSGTANPKAPRRHSRRSKARLKQPHPHETKDLNICVRENSPAQRESQDPNNPHPAAASRASGSNCGRRCSRTYTA